SPGCRPSATYSAARPLTSSTYSAQVIRCHRPRRFTRCASPASAARALSNPGTVAGDTVVMCTDTNRGDEPRLRRDAAHPGTDAPRGQVGLVVLVEREAKELVAAQAQRGRELVAVRRAQPHEPGARRLQGPS